MWLLCVGYRFIDKDEHTDIQQRYYKDFISTQMRNAPIQSPQKKKHCVRIHCSLTTLPMRRVGSLLYFIGSEQ
uniref:Uncharacterized protein n=1 Tax=Arundo donax TaxID=35708 RepID=A0A0A9BPC6_ARUDO